MVRFKGIGRRLSALLLSAALLLGGGQALPVKAESLSHVKVTAADVVNGTYYNSKGVQGTNFADLGDTVQNLNLNHMLLNVELNQFINTDGTGTPYTYNGKTYYFNEQEGSQLKVLLQRVKEYREQGITWTFCLVMNWSDDPAIQKLMYNPEKGKVYYALNVLDPEAQEQIAATLHWLVEKFSYKDTFVQNWRVGNEVNVSHDYNYTGAKGTTMPSVITGLATSGYNILYQALQDENPYARAYVSVTHDWNNSNEGKGMPTKDFLDAFSKGVIDPNWNIDFHAYPPQMKEQVWTKESAQYLTHEVETKFICGPNLEVLTDYVEEHFGSNHRIILSEQSYDSSYGEDEQAVMIAETYYAGVYNDMVDAIIFTTYQDTNSVYHDFYNMGIRDINGREKASYDVFRYMNTDQASVMVDPYLEKLSSWTNRTISSWTDDILYQAPKTTAVLNSVQLYHPDRDIYLASDRDPDQMVWIGATTSPTNKEVDLVFNWTAYNYTSKETLKIGSEILGNEWLEWYPSENATYKITCTVRVAGNPSSEMSDSMDVVVNMPGLPDSKAPDPEPTGRVVPHYDIREDGGVWDGTYYILDGQVVVDAFFCDGTYTYYLMTDGTAMKDRLTYHPDGDHVIYFDADGHEVFNDFALVGYNIPVVEKDGSITLIPLNENCYFDGNGYQYTNVVTWGKNGTDREGKLFYANSGGVLARGGWFTFSDDVKYAGDGSTWGAAGRRGYANDNCSLMRETYTYNENGDYCYIDSYGGVQ